MVSLYLNNRNLILKIQYPHKVYCHHKADLEVYCNSSSMGRTSLLISGNLFSIPNKPRNPLLTCMLTYKLWLACGSIISKEENLILGCTIKLTLWDTGKYIKP